MRTATLRRYLMCRPTYFGVHYRINPWMDPSAPVDTGLAVRQWTALRDAYRRLGHTVEEIEPLPGLPDMVFAANGATVIDGVAYGAQFRYPERADESTAYLSWFARNGFPPGRVGMLLSTIYEIKLNGLEFLLIELKKGRR